MAHYLITGHTGFKGAWFSLWLLSQGHEVSGISLPPISTSLFERTGLSARLTHDMRIDVRDGASLQDAVLKLQPDFVVHFAAQALVGEGYRNPRETYETNVVGTLNILAAANEASSVRSQLIVTTDKVYDTQGVHRPYVETDRLGGKDPYSVSKAMADLLAQEFLGRPDSKPGVVVRAGNVIGAGDVSRNRLIPDIVRTLEHNSILDLRYPAATRPWQHVLDCLRAYQILLEGAADKELAGPWNVGPNFSDVLSVREVVEVARNSVGTPFRTRESEASFPPEDLHLQLDCTKAEQVAGISCLLSAEEAIRWSLAEVHGGFSAIEDIGTLVSSQIEQFRDLAAGA